MQKEKVVDFLKLTGIDKFPDVIAAGLTEQIQSQFGVDEEGSAVFELPESAKKATALMGATLAAKKGELYDAIVNVYAKTFTDEELDQLLAFYKSGLGVKLVTLGGIILPEIAEVGNAWGVEAMKSIETEMSEILQ